MDLSIINQSIISILLYVFLVDMELNFCIIINIELCGCSLKVHFVYNDVVFYSALDIDVMRVCVFFECALINL